MNRSNKMSKDPFTNKPVGRLVTTTQPTGSVRTMAPSPVDDHCVHDGVWRATGPIDSGLGPGKLEPTRNPVISRTVIAVYWLRSPPEFDQGGLGSAGDSRGITSFRERNGRLCVSQRPVRRTCFRVGTLVTSTSKCLTRKASEAVGRFYTIRGSPFVPVQTLSGTRPVSISRRAEAIRPRRVAGRLGSPKHGELGKLFPPGYEYPRL